MTPDNYMHLPKDCISIRKLQLEMSGLMFSHHYDEHGQLGTKSVRINAAFSGASKRSPSASSTMLEVLLASCVSGMVGRFVAK
jgi:hypothetical protein